MRAPEPSAGAGRPATDGSTLRCTWIEGEGNGRLEVGPGEPLVDRTRLGEPARLTRELARLVHLTDAHVVDPSSPARVPFLARLGPPVQSTFRPHEALSAQTLHGAIRAARAQHPDLVIQGGDLIDNAQHNELTSALTLLGGGRVHPGSGPDGYHGVQLASNPDASYYRPDVDTPRHPGMLRRAVAPFSSRGLGSDWVAVLGDHDALVQGELVPSALTQSLAAGDRALWKMPRDLRLPGGSPDHDLLESFVEQALAGATVQVPPDRHRRQLTFSEVITRLTDASRAAAEPLHGGGTTPEGSLTLDQVRDVGAAVRLIVLDLVRREGGSGGLVRPEQPAWLERQLAEAGDRWVLLVTHQPIEDSRGGDEIFALLDACPRVIAALAGHTHRNRVIARETAAGGYWLITTCSLIDFPQQCRALRLYATDGGGVAIRTWMLDHVGNGRLGRVSRELARLDAGERAVHLTGTRWDRNATLFRARRRVRI